VIFFHFEMVRSRAEVKVIHSSLDYLTPNEFVAQATRAQRAGALRQMGPPGTVNPKLASDFESEVEFQFENGET